MEGAISKIMNATPANAAPILARAIRVEEQALVIVMADSGREVAVHWAATSPALKAATFSQRSRATLSPGGYGIHWPDVDEDLAIGALIRGA